MRAVVALLALTLLLSLPASSGEGEREALVHCVWFRGEGETAEGGTSPVVVRVSDNESGRPRVGVVEEYLGGAGSMWRGAAWLAAFNSSQVAGTPLVAHEFLVSSGGMIDGPSAGLLMTSTMTALLTGVPVRADTTMTGAVNPDGSAGPVGGIPQKMEGAARKGMKRFGFPIGARYSVDYKSGKRVDLFAHGKKLGLEVVELKDQWQAYELLTGKKLPRPAPVDETAMGPTPKQVELLEQRWQEWMKFLEGSAAKTRAAIEALPAEVRATTAAMLEEGQKSANEAIRLRNSGRFAAAHEALMIAWVDVRMADASAVVAKTVLAQDATSLVEKAKRERDSAHAELLELLGETGKRLPELTVDAVVNGAAALQDAARAFSLIEIAQQSFNAGERDGGRFDVQAVGLGLVYLAGARGKIAIARERLALYSTMRGRAKASPAALERHARAYGSAGHAALGYFESLVLEQRARSQGVSLDVARAAAAGSFDFFEYQVAQIEARLALGQGITLKDPTYQTLLELAAGSSAYVEAATLVNKHYSLGAARDQSGIVVVRQKDALTHQLRLARERTLSASGDALRALGYVPAASRWLFELAEVNQASGDDDKLTALDQYWTATLLAELAAALAKG